MDIKDFFRSKKLNFSSRVEFLTERKTEYLINATESYGIQFAPEKIIFVLDNTIFGSGMDGSVIASSGIAFKEIFQKPIYFSFNKINDIGISKRKITINQGEYVYDFTLINERDIEGVFGNIKDWLRLRDDFEINFDEYSEKVFQIQNLFKSRIIPLAKISMERENDKVNYNLIVESLSGCIDDLEELESSANKKNTDFNEANYIDNLFEMLTSFEKVIEESSTDFNENLLEQKPYDRELGKFLKEFFKPFIKEFQEALVALERIDKINKYGL